LVAAGAAVLQIGDCLRMGVIDPLQPLANGSFRGRKFATYWLGLPCRKRAIPRLLGLLKQLAR